VQPIRPAVAVALGPLESLGLPCQGRYSALSPVKPAVHLAAIGPLGPGRRLTAENLWTTASLGLEKKRNLQHPKMSPGSAHQLPYSDDAVLDPGFLFPQLGAAQTYPNLGWSSLSSPTVLPSAVDSLSSSRPLGLGARVSVCHKTGSRHPPKLLVWRYHWEEDTRLGTSVHLWLTPFHIESGGGEGLRVPHHFPTRKTVISCHDPKYVSAERAVNVQHPRAVLCEYVPQAIPEPSTGSTQSILS